MQERIDRPLEHFRSYVLSLLGDREYEKVVDSIAKVDRAFNRDTVPSPGPLIAPRISPFFPAPSFPVHTPSPADYPSPYMDSIIPPSRFSRGRSRGYAGSGRGARPYFCFSCGGSGHYQRHCPSKFPSMSATRRGPINRMARRDDRAGKDHGK